MKKSKRLIIPISFDNEDDYKYVKNMPNSSFYVRELVKKDRLEQQQDKQYIDKKIEEMKKYIDKKVNNGVIKKSNRKINNGLKNDMKNMFNAFK